MRADAVSSQARSLERRQFCTFWVSGYLYGVDILDVKEVHPEAPLTPVAHSPREVHGFVNIRGQIHLILDLRRLLGFEPKEPDESSRLILFKPCVGEAFGVLVDRISDVVEIEEGLIESGQLADEDLGGEHQDLGGIISGVCRLEEALLLVINARLILKRIERQPA